MAPNCAAAGASPGCAGGAGGHHAGVERHERLGQQFLTARLRSLPHHQDADGERGDDDDADHDQRPAAWRAGRRTPAPRPGPVRQLVFLQMVPFVVFHDLPCLSACVGPTPAGAPDRAWRPRAGFELPTSRLGGARSIQLSYGDVGPILAFRRIRPRPSPLNTAGPNGRCPAAWRGPDRNPSSIRNTSPTRSPPRSLTSFVAAAAVPPVASTSSTISTRCPLLDGVEVDLEGVGAVLERVGLADGARRQLARLADRDEAGAEPLGHRRAEDESAALDADDDVDALVADRAPTSASIVARKPAGSAAAW